MSVYDDAPVFSALTKPRETAKPGKDGRVTVIPIRSAGGRRATPDEKGWLGATKDPGGRRNALMTLGSAKEMGTIRLTYQAA